MSQSEIPRQLKPNRRTTPVSADATHPLDRSLWMVDIRPLCWVIDRHHVRRKL